MFYFGIIYENERSGAIVMYYILAYIYAALTLYVGIKTDFSTQKISHEMVILFLGLSIVYILYISVFHYMYWMYVKKYGIKKYENDKKMSSQIASSFDGISILAICIFLLLLFSMPKGESIMDYSILFFTSFLVSPIYLVNNVRYWSNANQIKYLIDQFNNLNVIEHEICVFENENYKKMLSDTKVTSIYHQRVFHKYFRKSIMYRNVYEYDRYLFVPNVLLPLLEAKGINPSAYVDEKELFDKSRTIEENLAHFIRGRLGSKRLMQEADDKLRPIIEGESTDRGKQIARKMVEKICYQNALPIEFFYDLLKVAEYITHYQSLVDYESNNSTYFDNPKEMSFGAFADSIVEVEKSQLYKSDSFAQGYKYVNQIITGREGRLPSKKLAHMTRMLFVQVRNKYVGHGVMTYSIEEEFVVALMNLLCPLLDDFMHYTEDMSKMQIGNLSKRQDDFLLLCVYKNNCGLYLNYESGDILQVGDKHIIKLSE